MLIKPFNSDDDAGAYEQLIFFFKDPDKTAAGNIKYES